MKSYKETKIIGIDHGYGNIKTANFCFKTGVAAYDSEPLFTKDMLVYNGKYYLIGEGHKEYAAEKMQDEEYYVLTLAAITMELSCENIADATVHIAAGSMRIFLQLQKAMNILPSDILGGTVKRHEREICKGSVQSG
jgi:plasmid segregation protein ParM